MRKVPFLPGPGGYVAVREESVRLGGEAANTAYALAKWGAPFRLVGNAVEEKVREKLVQHGLPLDHLSTATERAPICDIYVTPDGQRTMFGMGFDRMEATMADVPLPLEGATWFTMDMNFGDRGWQAADTAGEKGIARYVMDAVPEHPLKEGDMWQSSTDWVGTPGNMAANLKWAEKHARRWNATVILTDSGRELVVARPDGKARAFPTFPPPLTSKGGVGEHDSTGAGDRFRAGMLFGLSSAWPLEECLAFAAAAASLKLAHAGGIAPVPTVGEVNAYRRQHRGVDGQFAVGFKGSG